MPVYAMIEHYLRWTDRLTLIAAALAGISLLTMAGLMLTEVIARSFLSTSLTFSWEFSGYLMGAVFFFGAAYTLRSGGHVRVMLLPEVLPPCAAWWLDFAATLVGSLVAAMLAFALSQLAWISFGRSIVSFTPTQTPLVIPQSVLAFGAILLCLQLIARLLRLLRGEAADLPPQDSQLGSDQ